MNRLVIHKDVNQKTLFRVLGGSIYKNHYWDIASNKEELIAYLTQFYPNIISIGPLPGMTTIEVAQYLRTLYTSIRRMKIPDIMCVEHDKLDEVKRIMKGQNPRQN